LLLLFLDRNRFLAAGGASVSAVLPNSPASAGASIMQPSANAPAPSAANSSCLGGCGGSEQDSSPVIVSAVQIVPQAPPPTSDAVSLSSSPAQPSLELRGPGIWGGAQNTLVRSNITFVAD